MNYKKMKFGVMCSKDMTFPKWQADAISNLINHDGIECSLVIKNSTENLSTFKSRVRQLKFPSLLWQIYSYIIGRSSLEAARVSFLDVLSKTPQIECSAIMKGKFFEVFRDKDVELIKSYNLDFILRFEYGIIKGEVLNAAKHGVWSFHHGDELEFRGGPPGFWEIYEGRKVTGSILQKLNEKLDAGVVLKKGFLETQLGYIENRDQMFLESARWPLQVCIELQQNELSAKISLASPTNSVIKIAPTNIQLVFFLIKNNVAKIKQLFRMLLYVDYWNIGVVHHNLEHFLTNDYKPPVHWFPLNSTAMFYADPCGLEDANGCDIFFEEYPYKKGKGVISHTHYSNGVFSNPEVILEDNFHLSYPFVLEDQGRIYMVPESFEANKVMLYEAVDFPKKWEMVKVLINDYCGVDSTLLKYKGIWWMFSSDRNQGSSHNLNLFYSDDLLGEWLPHPCNPIKTDLHSARSAGKPYIYNEKIWRPSMNYSEKNEGSITLNLITNLTKCSYSEVASKEILPYKESQFPDKIHHLFSTENYTFVDGCKEVFVLKSLSMIRHQMALVLKRITKFVGV